MIEVGSRVTKSPTDPTVYQVEEIEDDAVALLAPTGDAANAPGAYPFWWRLQDLVAVE